jgi:hypothetical protein
VVFIEVRGKYEPKESIHIEKNLDIVRFELRNQEHDLDELTEYKEEVEQLTLLVRS